MKALEKARIALRKQLQENKDKVKADLKRMREISNGTDIFSYIENLSDTISIEKIEVVDNVSVNCAIDDLEIDTYGIIEDLNNLLYDWLPPDIIENNDDYNKKSSEILSELFF